MEIKTLKVGDLRTNCYLVSEGGEGLVIDPGAEPEKIIKEIGDLKIKAIILTHGHYDHVTSAFSLKEKLGAPIMIGEKDESLMVLSTGKRADKLLKDKDKFVICPASLLQKYNVLRDPALRDNLSFVIIETPGHTPGGISLYNEKEKVVFTGDTLFAGDWGRTDLPGSSEAEMQLSLQELLKLPPETKVYPGHGQATTIGDEKNLLKSI